jgi:DNA invertase Pin-like site-specific DNA recombinase
MHALAYVRVSTQEQSANGAGLEAQREATTAECQRRGWKLADTIEDAGYSARNLKRPGIQTALERLAAGEADVLVVAKLDRLSRSVVDFAGLMERAAREGWALAVLDLGVDTSTPSGEMIANVLATFAQFERRLIGQRTREALAVKKSQGVQLGRPRSLPDDVRERIVREREKGSSLTAIAERLNAEGVATAQGGQKWWPSTVRSVVAAGSSPAPS